MLIGRFSYCNKEFFGQVINDRVYELENFFSNTKINEYSLTDLKILCPTRPSKIIAVGLNYRDHAEELKMKIPDEPVIFFKSPNTLIADKEYIIYPEMSKQIDYEAELAIVIGRKIKNANEKEATQAILGISAFNDITARDLQKKDGQWTRAKNFDTFGPYGPFINTDFDFNDELKIEAYKNDILMQKGYLKDMIFKPIELIVFISKIMTLEPEDVIITGTPKGIGPLVRGDTIKIKIEGVPVLTNYVK